MRVIGIAMVAWAGLVVQVVAMSVAVVLPFIYWWGATYFTVNRRMMLTSFVLSRASPYRQQ
jgi:hypothetical protein